MLCRIHTFLTYYLTHMSSIVLMAVSIERTLVLFNKTIITFLLKQTKLELNFLKNCLKFNRIEKVILLIGVSLAFINVHYIYFFSLSVINQNQTQSFMREPILGYIENATINDTSHVDLNGTSWPIEPDILNNTTFSNLTLVNDTIDTSTKKNNVHLCYPLNEFSYNIFLNNIWTW